MEKGVVDDARTVGLDGEDVDEARVVNDVVEGVDVARLDRRAEGLVDAIVAAHPPGAPGPPFGQNGLAWSMWCMGVHESAKRALRGRTRRSSTGTRIESPSFVFCRRSTKTESWPSTTMLPRQLAMRKTRCGAPSRSWTTAFSAKRTRAVGRANLAKVAPVTMATPSVPTSASTTTTTWPYLVAGAMAP